MTDVFGANHNMLYIALVHSLIFLGTTIGGAPAGQVPITTLSV